MPPPPPGPEVDQPPAPIADVPPWPDVAPLPHFKKADGRDENGSAPSENPPATPPPLAGHPPLPGQAFQPPVGDVPPLPAQDAIPQPPPPAPEAPLSGTPLSGAPPIPEGRELSPEELLSLPPPVTEPSSLEPPMPGGPPMPDPFTRLPGQDEDDQNPENPGGATTNGDGNQQNHQPE